MEKEQPMDIMVDSGSHDLSTFGGRLHEFKPKLLKTTEEWAKEVGKPIRAAYLGAVLHNRMNPGLKHLTAIIRWLKAHGASDADVVWLFLGGAIPPPERKEKGQ